LLVAAQVEQVVLEALLPEGGQVDLELAQVFL
jgi:hypothetical protein